MQVESFKIAKCAVSSTGAKFEDALEFDDWKKIGRQLAALRDWSNWAVGDFLIYGEDHYSAARYQASLELFGLARHTLHNIATVCRAFPHSRRRELPLTFTHHAEVAHLTPREQEKYLDLAQAEDLGTLDLRELVRTEKEGGRREIPDKVSDPAPTAFTTPLNMWIERQHHETWPEAKREFWKRELKPAADLYAKL